MRTGYERCHSTPQAPIQARTLDLKVVNDHAEREVALVQELSGLLTQNEEQFQFMLHVVQENRRLYPDALKRTLTGGSNEWPDPPDFYLLL